MKSLCKILGHNFKWISHWTYIEKVGRETNINTSKCDRCGELKGDYLTEGRPHKREIVCDHCEEPTTDWKSTRLLKEKVCFECLEHCQDTV